jgi:Ion channel
MAFGRPDQVATHRYGRVLLATVVVIVATIALPDDHAGRGAGLLLQALLLVMVTIAARDTRSRALTAIGGAAVAFGAISAVGVHVPGWVLLFLSSALAAAMLVTLALGVLTLIRTEGVDVQAVAGGLVTYLLVGLIFADVVGALADAGHGMYFAQNTDGTSGDHIYFSFITLTTTGYGDFTPRTQLGRSISTLEVLLGQIYLVVVVALLVGNLKRRDA